MKVTITEIIKTCDRHADRLNWAIHPTDTEIDILDGIHLIDNCG